MTRSFFSLFATNYVAPCWPNDRMQHFPLHPSFFYTVIGLTALPFNCSKFSNQLSVFCVCFLFRSALCLVFSPLLCLLVGISCGLQVRRQTTQEVKSIFLVTSQICRALLPPASHRSFSSRSWTCSFTFRDDCLVNQVTSLTCSTDCRRCAASCTANRNAWRIECSRATGRSWTLH